MKLPAMRDSIPALPRGYTLPLNEIHLWQIALDSAPLMIEGFFDFMCEAERSRAARFHLVADRYRFVMGRAMLRLLVGALLGTAPGRLVIQQDDYGKPFVEHEGRAPRFSFNVSHSGRHVLVALARGRSVGVDVELICPAIDVAAIAKDFFSSHERAELEALPIEHRLVAFFRCWCRKEALIKAMGLGLSYPLADFDVSVAPAPSPVLLRTRPGDKEANRWHIRDLNLDAQHVAAIATEAADFTLRTWQLVGDACFDTTASCASL